VPPQASLPTSDCSQRANQHRLRLSCAATLQGVNNMQYQVPSHTDSIKVSFPAEHVLLITFNRPKSLNAMSPDMTKSIGTVLDWFENEPTLWYVRATVTILSAHTLCVEKRVVVITGEGRIFCAGADLHAYVTFSSPLP
jgi:enoyl-CoA hydratase/carnithine racemase